VQTSEPITAIQHDDMVIIETVETKPPVVKRSGSWGILIIQLSFIAIVLAVLGRLYMKSKSRKVKYTFDEGESVVPYTRLVSI